MIRLQLHCGTVRGRWRAVVPRPHASTHDDPLAYHPTRRAPPAARDRVWSIDCCPHELRVHGAAGRVVPSAGSIVRRFRRDSAHPAPAGDLEL